MKRRKLAFQLITALAVLGGFESPSALAQESTSFSAQQSNSASPQTVHLPYAQFQIPFNVDASGSQPSAVQLLVSTDAGKSWQQQARTSPGARHFDFRAAAEGEYLFSVQTVDAAGVAFPSPGPPMRVRIDTTKPQAAVRADLDHSGHLIVDLRAADDHIDLKSAVLKIRSDRDPQWREIPVSELTRVGNYYESQIEVLIPQCREIAILFSIADQAKNNGSASYLFTVPRTAAQPNDLQLASTQSKSDDTASNNVVRAPSSTAQTSPAASSIAGYASQPIAGAVPWDLSRTPQANNQSVSVLNFGQPSVRPGNPGFGTSAPSIISAENQAADASRRGNYPTTPRGSNLNSLKQQSDNPTKPTMNQSPGQLARTAVDVELSPAKPSGPEELYMPEPYQQRSNGQSYEPGRSAGQADADGSGFSKPYYCKARTFSLDYSVEALGGNALSQVELWGTEDNGRSWEKWGSDPDRVSPFDVRVGNDGLFGFRMVLVGSGGAVLGSPKAGDDADAWIRVDTESPQCKITRAVYGVGSEAGMLVIDYTCEDSDLTEEGTSLSWSPTTQGPWTPIASAFKNTGLYLWKADPGLPNRVYLKLEAIDKAGNKGVHQMDLPIDTKGLAPRGRIQGIRPITD